MAKLRLRTFFRCRELRRFCLPHQRAVTYKLGKGHAHHVDPVMLPSRLFERNVVEAHGVTIVGYTDYASRMATQASTLYANNIRHMLTDLTPKKDGVIVHDMEDDVIRGATVAHGGAITWPPPTATCSAPSAASWAASVTRSN